MPRIGQRKSSLIDLPRRYTQAILQTVFAVGLKTTAHRSMNDE